MSRLQRHRNIDTPPSRTSRRRMSYAGAPTSAGRSPSKLRMMNSEPARGRQSRRALIGSVFNTAARHVGDLRRCVDRSRAVCSSRGKIIVSRKTKRHDVADDLLASPKDPRNLRRGIPLEAPAGLPAFNRLASNRPSFVPDDAPPRPPAPPPSPGVNADASPAPASST